MFILLCLILSFSPLLGSQAFLEGYYAPVTEKQADDIPVAALKKGLSTLKKHALNTERLYTGYHTLQWKESNKTYTIVLRAPLLFHALLLFNTVQEKNDSKKQDQKIKTIHYLCQISNTKKAQNQEIILYHNDHGTIMSPLYFALRSNNNEEVIKYLITATNNKRLSQLYEHQNNPQNILSILIQAMHNHYSIINCMILLINKCPELINNTSSCLEHPFETALRTKRYDLANILYTLNKKNHALYRALVTHFLFNLKDTVLIESAYEIIINHKIPFDSLLKDRSGQTLLTRILSCNPHLGTTSVVAKQEQLFATIKRFFDIKKLVTVKLSDSLEEKNLLDIASYSHCSLPIITTLSGSGLTLTPERLSNSQDIE